MRIPDGVLPAELANDPDVVTRKAGLTPWHARLLKALEQIASYYAALGVLERTPSNKITRGKDA